MKRIVYKIDEEGFILWETGLVIDEDEEIPEGYYLQPVYGENQPSLYKPKWNGETWIEGATQEEIDELRQQSTLPTLEERIGALEQYALEQIFREVK